MDSDLIKFENVDFYYEKGKAIEVAALKNINLSIKRGEYVAFFGPSGCGKTTLLFTVAGIEKPSSGKILINNKDITLFTQRELALYRQMGVGIIFQNFNLIPSITVIENVSLPMAFLGLSVDARKKRAMEILERLDITNLAYRYPHELSGGQQQRVGIARAMSNNPPILLADEPLGNLDSANANRVLDFLRELNQKDGQTIVMVTHEAWSLRDVNRIFYMRDGAITRVETKTPEHIKKGTASYYYKKLYPEMRSAEARAKAISQFLLKGHSQEEIKRLEYFLIQFLRGQIDIGIFKAVLDRPYKDGGVGLWSSKAKKIAQQIEEVIKEEKNLKGLFERLESNPEANLKSEIEETSNWLIRETKMKLTPLQQTQFNEATEERIKNIITSEHFIKVLNLSKLSGGLGLKISTTLKIKDKLEAILGKEEKSEKEKENYGG